MATAVPSLVDSVAELLRAPAAVLARAKRRAALVTGALIEVGVESELDLARRAFILMGAGGDDAVGGNCAQRWPAVAVRFDPALCRREEGPAFACASAYGFLAQR